MALLEFTLSGTPSRTHPPQPADHVTMDMAKTVRGLSLQDGIIGRLWPLLGLAFRHWLQELLQCRQDALATSRTVRKIDVRLLLTLLDLRNKFSLSYFCPHHVF